MKSVVVVHELRYFIHEVERDGYILLTWDDYHESSIEFID